MSENMKCGAAGVQEHFESEHPNGALSKKAMEYLVGLGQRERDFVTVNIDGHIYTNAQNLKRVEPVLPKAPQVQEPYTLMGFVEFIRCNIDVLHEQYGKLMVMVDNERLVSLMSAPCGPENATRLLLAVTRARTEPFKFGVSYSQEEFVVALQSRFMQDEISAKVGMVVGNLVNGHEVNTSDDGISQRAVVKTGVARVGDVVIENPVMLRPYRTFVEIDQPKSPFVLRIKAEKDSGQPYIALHEADGGMWKVEAVGRIYEFLCNALAPIIDEGKLVVIG